MLIAVKDSPSGKVTAYIGLGDWVLHCLNEGQPVRVENGPRPDSRYPYGLEIVLLHAGSDCEMRQISAQAGLLPLSEEIMKLPKPRLYAHGQCESAEEAPDAEAA